MPITTPSVNTNITPINTGDNANLAAWLKGLQGFNQGLDTEVKGQQAKAYQAQQLINDLIKQKNQAGLDEQGAKSRADQVAQRHTDNPTEDWSISKEGASVRDSQSKIDAANIRAQGVALNNNNKQGETAYNLADKNYNTAVTGPKGLSTQLDGLQEMQDAVNSAEPNAKARLVAGYMKAKGFARFNQAESNWLTNPDLKTTAARALQHFGIDPNDVMSGSLNSVNKQMYQTMVDDGVTNIDQAHQAVVNNVLSQYHGSAHATPERGQYLQQNLPTAFNKRLNSFKQSAQQHAGVAPSATPGIPKAGTGAQLQFTPEQVAAEIARRKQSANPLSSLGIGSQGPSNGQ